MRKRGVRNIWSGALDEWIFHPRRSHKLPDSWIKFLNLQWALDVMLPFNYSNNCCAASTDKLILVAPFVASHINALRRPLIQFHNLFYFSRGSLSLTLSHWRSLKFNINSAGVEQWRAKRHSRIKEVLILIFLPSLNSSPRQKRIKLKKTWERDFVSGLFSCSSSSAEHTQKKNMCNENKRNRSSRHHHNPIHVLNHTRVSLIKIKFFFFWDHATLNNKKKLNWIRKYPFVGHLRASWHS